MGKFIKEHKAAVAVFFIAFFLRLAFFGVAFQANDFDLVKTIKGDDGYFEISQNVLEGNGFSWDAEPPYRLNPLRPPLWPGLIAFFAFLGGGSYFPVSFLLLVLGSLIPVLGMKLAERFLYFFKGEEKGNSRFKKIGLLIGIGLSLDPYGILLSTILYTETSFTFFFLLGLLFFASYLRNYSWRSIVWSGVFLGLSTLIKPTIQYASILLPLFIICFYYFSRERGESRLPSLKRVLGQGGVFAAVFLAIISPWAYANYKEYGVMGMGAQPAFNLYVYLVPTVLAIDNRTDFKTEHEAFVKKDGFDEKSITLQNSKEYSGKAMEILADHKFALLKSVGVTLVTFFTHDGLLTFFQYAGVNIPVSSSKPALSLLLGSPLSFFESLLDYARGSAVFIIIMRFVWIIISLFMVLGTISLFRNYKKREARLALLFIASIIGYFALTTAINGFGVNARFRIPVTSLILFLAAYGFVSARLGRFLRLHRL